jgi:uncharacterized membrane-anchored protein YhcB (DUF1043 family)
MEQILWYAGGLVACLVVGFVIGVLFMRNNYKGLRAYEQEFKDLVLDAKVSNDQLVTRIRNRLKV